MQFARIIRLDNLGPQQDQPPPDRIGIAHCVSINQTRRMSRSPQLL